jgi:hypothetical protein
VYIGVSEDDRHEIFGCGVTVSDSFSEVFMSFILSVYNLAIALNYAEIMKASVPTPQQTRVHELVRD